MGFDENELGLILVTLSAVGFSTLAILSKLAFENGLNVVTVLTFRFVLSSILVWSILFFQKNLRILKGASLVVAIGLGGLGYASMSGFYLWGLNFITAGLASIILYTYPVFVVLISIFKLDERITRWTIVSLILTLTGIIFIARVDPAGADLRGVILVLSASLVYSTYITISRNTLFTVDSRVLTAHVLPSAAVSFLLFGMFTDQLMVPGSLDGWFVVLGIAVIATAIPIFAFFSGLSRIGASRASIISTIEPPITVFLGVIILGEQLTFNIIFGGILILTGVIIVQIKLM